MQYLRSIQCPPPPSRSPPFSQPPPAAIGSLPALLRPHRPRRRPTRALRLTALVAVQTRAPPPSPRPLRLGPPRLLCRHHPRAPRVLPPLLDSPGTPLLAKGPVDRESAREQGSTPRARPTQSLPSHAVSTRGWTNPYPAPRHASPACAPRIARVCASPHGPIALRHRPPPKAPLRPGASRAQHPRDTRGPGTVFESRFRRTAARLPSSHGSS